MITLTIEEALQIRNYLIMSRIEMSSPLGLTKLAVPPEIVNIIADKINKFQEEKVEAVKKEEPIKTKKPEA